MIVDDMADIRLFVKKILEGDGATVVEASGVDEAIDRIRQRAPNLVITDLDMPVRSGFDFLRARQDDPKGPAVPVIVLSGLKDRESVNEAIGLGAVDYILKPIQATLLLQKARKHLRSREFFSRKFAAGTRPLATVTLPASVVKISEIGALIESAVRLLPNRSVNLSGPFMDQFRDTELGIRTAVKPDPYSLQGRYYCELNFVGLGQNSAKALRRKFKEIK